jgi:hypothetical protein
MGSSFQGKIGVGSILVAKRDNRATKIKNALVAQRVSAAELGWKPLTSQRSRPKPLI